MTSVVAILTALTSALFFGAATPASKVLLAHLSPFQLSGLLYLGAALMMVARNARRPQVRLAELDPVNRRRLAGAVIAGGMIGPVLMLAGLRLAPAGEVSLLLNFEMAATAVLGAALFHEPLTRNGWLGVVGIVCSGVILAGGDWPGVAAAALVAAACICWGLDNHLTALIDGITPSVSTFWKGIVAGSVNLAIGVLLVPLSASGWQIAAALALGAVSYGASIALYIRAAQQLGAVRAQALFAAAPFFGAALSFVFLGERLTAETGIASVMLIASAWLLFGGVHAHTHRHPAIEHVHDHRHDDGHHTHTHPNTRPDERHSHSHVHDEVVHAHPHWPDLHHRHSH